MRPAELLLAGLLALPAPAQEWQRVRPGLELSFPADHGAHPDHRTEWWYLTGQLESAGGRRFGFQFTVFRRGLAPGPGAAGSSPLRARQVLAGHLALTDVEGRRTRFAERLRRVGSPLASVAEQDLELVLEDWSLSRSGDDDELRVSAADPARGIGLELVLVPRKPLVLHGARGYSAKGADPGNASAYASWTSLDTRGSVELDGRSIDVRGEAWYDHEFGTSVLEDGVRGWDWFGLQLDDGRELMLFLLRREDGTFSAASAGTLVGVDGAARALGAGDFRIEALDTWASPRSAAAYPSRWRITVPSAELELEARPLVADCELTAAGTTGVAYWEGPVEVRDETGEAGRGYAELTGYAGTMEGRF